MKSNTNLLRTTVFAILSLFTMQVSAQFSGEGSGTEGDPYRITNALQLSQMANFLNDSNVYFQLENDIDLTEWISENSPRLGWTPIGNKDMPFCGHFDGQNHIVFGFSMNRSSEDTGFWGYIDNATIKRLTIKGTTIIGGKRAGVFAGTSYNSKLSECHAVLYDSLSSNINPSDLSEYAIGGICGIKIKGIFDSCSFRGDISSRVRSGGIVGYTYNNSTSDLSIIRNCCFIGQIRSTASAGGIVGVMDYYIHSYQVSGKTDKGNTYYRTFEEACNCFIYDNIVIGSIFGYSVGGILGRGSNCRLAPPSNYYHSFYNHSIYKNVVNANISGMTYAAGICGRVYYTEIAKNIVISSIIKNENRSQLQRVVNIENGDEYVATIGSSSSNRVSVTTKTFEKEDEIIFDDDIYNGMTVGPTSLRNKDNYIGWGYNFDTDWAIVDGISYPYKPYMSAPPIIDGTLHANATTITGVCGSGGKIYLYYNNHDEPVSTECVNQRFTFSTEPLIDGTTVRIYSDNDITTSYTMESVVGKGGDNSDAVASITLSSSFLTMDLGDTNQLSAIILPSTVTNKNVTWKSNSESIASVTSTGIVTALSPGSTIITCTAADGSGKTATCTVNVKNPAVPVAQIKLNYTSYNLVTGKGGSLAAAVLPINASYKKVKWTSTDENIVKVNSEGVLSAISTGVAQIYCTATDGSGVSDVCRVTVMDTPTTILVSQITLSVNTLNLAYGNNRTLIATVTPADAENKTLSWSSGNINVASVNSDGLVTAIADGTATIYCTATDGSGITATCTVTVGEGTNSEKNTPVEIENISYIFDESGKTAEIAKRTGTSYSGNVSIPSTVTYNGVTYNVTSIGESAFQNCLELTSIDIPNTVVSIGDAAFWGCSNMVSLTIPNSVTYIGNDAFRFTGLTTISIPDNVEVLNNCSFAGCSNLSSVTIGSGLKQYVGTAFIDNSNLTSIIVDPNNAVFDSRNNCNAVIQKSNNELMTGCQSTVIPEDVETIGYYAFRGSSGLTQITIPSNVNNIGHQAFNDCDNLMSVTVQSQTPPTLQDEGSINNRANATLYVPKGSKAAYQAADYWKDFKEIIELDENGKPIVYTTITMSNTNTWGTWIGTKDMELVDGLEAYVVTNVNPNSGKVYVTKQSAIKAGTPMLLHRTGAAYSFVLPSTSDVVIYGVPSYLFQGVMSTTAVSSLIDNESQVYILVNDQFVRTRSGNIPAGKCYLSLPETSLARMNIMIDDEATGVEEVWSEMPKARDYHDLQGRRVVRPTKGLYIVNGKKMVVK